MTSSFMVDARDQKTDIFNPVAWEQFKGMAQYFIRSGALPESANAEQLVVKMQAGYEMGMKPFEAIRALYIVKGVISIGGRDLILQLRKHGWSVSYDKESLTEITATIFKGEEKYTDTFKFSEAESSGWTKDFKGNMKPAWMPGANRNLKMRYAIVSKIVKSYIPEVMGSATDVFEVAEDTQPLYDTYSVKEVQMLDDDDPITTNQMETLQNLKIEIPDGTTKGQARKLIKDAIDATKKNPTPAKSREGSDQELSSGESVDNTGDTNQ